MLEKFDKFGVKETDLKPHLKKAYDMIIPILSLMLPALIHSAEQIFSGEKKGPEKRVFVMNAVSAMIDKTTLPKYVDKQLIVELAAVLVDHYVPTLVK